MSDLWDVYNVSVKIEMFTRNSKKKKISCNSEFKYHSADLICNSDMKNQTL